MTTCSIVETILRLVKEFGSFWATAKEECAIQKERSVNLNFTRSVSDPSRASVHLRQNSENTCLSVLNMLGGVIV